MNEPRRKREDVADTPAGEPGRSGWKSIGILREVILRLHVGWTGLSPEARGRWWRSLVVGYLATAALMVGLVRGARLLDGSGALAWDRPVLGWIVDRPPISFSTAMWLEGLGNGFVLWAVVLYAACAAAWARRPIRTIALLVGYTLVYPVIFLGWWMWDRERPRIVLEGLTDPGGVFRAFPSGHMVQAAFAYGFLFLLWYRASASRGERLFIAAAYLLLMAVVGFGRLRIGAHWPSDILAGALIGWACLTAVVVAMRRAENPPADRLLMKES